jgi:NAD(P)-dependent dehydrogenase (short-subunit alcohol dehydrogenase family)
MIDRFPAPRERTSPASFRRVRDKVVVITGAGSGIGRATARLFGGLGARLHLVDVDGAAVEAVCAEIGSATPHTVDCSDAAAVEALAERVFAAEGRVDVLHNNAGIGHAGELEATTTDDWRRVIEVNLLGVAYGMQAFAPRMLRQGGGGSIVNTASAAGLFGIPEMAPYCASKWGVVGMTEALDTELRPRGVRVSAVCPGIIDTPITRNAVLRGRAADRREEAVELYRKRGASAEDVARTVLEAVRKPRLVHTVPSRQITPVWLLKRLFPRVLARIVSVVTRLSRRD